ncbi:Protein HIGH ARSENIC CONTENT 1, mitochondrial, partial [Cucurbita argyrosperma subsp. sororia]
MESEKRPEDVVTVDVQVAKDLLQKGQLYLDVRSDLLFFCYNNLLSNPRRRGRVKNPDFLAQVTSILKKEDHVVVACNSGGRGHRACIDLRNAGYEHVKNMAGGYSAWVDSGFAGDKPAEELKIACKFRG